MTRARMYEARRVLDELLTLETDECVLWPFARSHNGYGVVSGGPVNNRRVHRVACERHYGPCPDGMEAAHSCGTRACLNYRHLRWATLIQNVQDRVRHGGTRLTEADVLEIRRRLAAGETQAQIVKAYGVSQQTISHLAVGRHWSWVA